MIEDDTYSLIPNGEGPNEDGNEWIKYYLVQHDQSGETISWKGKSGIWYDRVPHTSAFFTFASWSTSQRKSWKDRERIRMDKEAKIMPMYSLTSKYDDEFYDEGCDCDICECIDTVQTSILQRNNKMNYATANIIATTTPSVESEQRQYLLRRLENMYYSKRDEAHAFFKMDPVESPKTLKEFFAQIEKGDYSFDEKDADVKFWDIYALMAQIRWSKDPADKKGFEAAEEKIRTAYKDAIDTIKILSPEEGLKALKAFEAQTFY